MCYQLRSTTIPQAKHHKFKRLLVAMRFGPEHPLVFLWPRLQREKRITICGLKQFSTLRNNFLFAK